MSGELRMKILGLEFSSPQRSVAVLDAVGGVVRAAGERVETGGRSIQALGMVEETLREAQVEREQIECLAIGLGPGSYTGIRAAIALGQGWQLAREVKLVGISSAECIAAEAHHGGLRGRCAVAIDAQRTEFYLASYELDGNGWTEVEPLRLANRSQAEACQAAGLQLIGPEVTRWFPAGRIVFPRAARLAELARAKTDFVPGERLEPIYLRETAFVKAPAARSAL
jgi:tRNA threonylcarbamoyl adenosine modification protein YeaZ